MAVAIDWRTTVNLTSTESEGRHIADPEWLVAINGVSLAIAIIANFALLGQITDQVRYTIAAPVTIVGWYISSFLLIALVSAAPAHLPLPTTEPATYSQAFYYACFAAAMYLILSILLTVTALGSLVYHISFGFKLTMSQRSLMLQTMLFLGYLLAAGAVYTKIEGWDFLDSVHFVNVTLFTIGFGDFSPKTHTGRSLFFPMAVGGILFVGLIIGSIRTLVLESGSRKISTRMVERARDKALRRHYTQHVREDRKDMAELERREEEFNIMRQVQRSATRTNRMISLAVSGTAFFLLWIVGSVVFWQAEQATGGENWTYFESFYFTYVALLTIGYGDFYPQTNSAKPAFVFWSLIALPTLTVLIGAIGDCVSDFVASSILWLGDHLPESTSFLLGLKKTAQKKKNRAGAFEEGKPPGFMDEEQPEGSDFDNQEQAAAVAAIGSDQQKDTEERQDRDDAERAGETYRLYLVMKEMKNVVQHLDASPPRKYDYSEWTWFMKLIKEDETTPEGHRRPWHDPSLVHSPVRDHEQQVWSWLGQESPLMSMENEPKWVLIRLMEVVEREVKKKGDFERKRGGS